MQTRAAKIARHSAVTQLQSEASQSILTMNSESDKPLDSYFVVLISLYMLGIGSLLSITTLFAAPDYLQLQLNFSSDQQIIYFITPSYILPNLVITMLMIRYGHLPSFEIRITFSFITQGCCLMAIPILFIDPIINVLGQKWIFYIILLLSLMIGISSAVLSTSILAFSQFFPIKYLRGLVVGQSLAMIIICIVRIGIKLSFGLETGGVIYYSFSAGFNILCAVLFIVLITYHPFVAHYIHPYLVSKDRRHIERKVRQLNENNTKTHSRSIRNSVAILPSHVSYFSNIKHFKHHKPTGKQHPNSPNKHKQSSNAFENDENDENNDEKCRDDRNEAREFSMPTRTILKKESTHKRTRSNTDNDIDALELKQQTKQFSGNNLNDLSLSNYSIQSSEQLLGNDPFIVTEPVVKSQPDTIKSALITGIDHMITTRDHAASEIIVYPQTYISSTHTKLAGASPNNLHISPQSPIESGYQFHYQPPPNFYDQTRASHTSFGSYGLKYEYGPVAKKILKSIWSLFIVFFVTYLVFPGLILSFQSQYKSINSNDWFPVILVSEWTCFDLLGRQLNGIAMFNKCGQIYILSSLRIVLYPLFILVDHNIIIGDNIVYIIVGLCAFSNGFLICSTFVNYKHNLYQHEQEIGAAFMQLASTLAVLGSSVIALIVYEIAKYN